VAENATLSAVVEAELAAILERYRVDADHARPILVEELSKESHLRALVECSVDLTAVQRTRAYRDAIKRARKRVYYALRRYVVDQVAFQQAVIDAEKAVAAGEQSAGDRFARMTTLHASTRERLADLSNFHARLKPFLSGLGTIVDVGAGVYPLMFPIDDFGNASLVALEREPWCVRAIRALARHRHDERVRAFEWKISDGWKALDGLSVDAVLMLKLIPVVARQEPGMLDVLRRAPARCWVLSGSKSALAKRENIENRERKILLEFVQSTGRRIVSEFSTELELVYVTENPDAERR
jgi:hypothetical protein